MTKTATMETAAADIAAVDAPMAGAVPHLALDGASAASEFYQRAFGAQETFRLPTPDGQRLAHCTLKLNGGTLMLCDLFPEMSDHEGDMRPTGFVTLHLQVDDIDAWFERAVAAGATVLSPVELMFWGDRYGRLRDPFGVCWSMGQTVKQA